MLLVLVLFFFALFFPLQLHRKIQASLERLVEERAANSGEAARALLSEALQQVSSCCCIYVCSCSYCCVSCYVYVSSPTTLRVSSYSARLSARSSPRRWCRCPRTAGCIYVSSYYYICVSSCYDVCVLILGKAARVLLSEALAEVSRDCCMSIVLILLYI